MEISKINAYIIMEETSPVQKFKVTKVKNEFGLEFLRFRACLQSLDVVNRNKRLYTTKAILAGLQAQNIQELIRKGTWVGENGHPITDDIKRVTSYDPNNLSHRILDYELAGNLLYGTIETLADKGPGKSFMYHILQGLEASFSLRALAALTKKGDTTYITSRPFVVTYDRVIFPSHKEAYMDTTAPIQLSESANSLFVDNTSKSNDSLDLSGDVAIKIMEESVMQYILEEDKNAKDIISFFDCATESATLSVDKKSIILKNETNRFIVPIDEYIREETSAYLSRLGK